MSARRRRLSKESVNPAVVSNSAVPDGFGGLIVTSCPSGNPMTVSDLGPTGQVLWQEFAAGVNTGNGTITYLCNAPYIAVRGDGAVVVTEATNVGLPSVTLNGQMYSIPPSTVTSYGNTIDVLCCAGAADGEFRWYRTLAGIRDFSCALRGPTHGIRQSDRKLPAF